MDTDSEAVSPGLSEAGPASPSASRAACRSCLRSTVARSRNCPGRRVLIRRRARPRASRAAGPPLLHTVIASTARPHRAAPCRRRGRGCGPHGPTVGSTGCPVRCRGSIRVPARYSLLVETRGARSRRRRAQSSPRGARSTREPLSRGAASTPPTAAASNAAEAASTARSPWRRPTICSPTGSPDARQADGHGRRGLARQVEREGERRSSRAGTALAVDLLDDGRPTANGGTATVGVISRSKRARKRWTSVHSSWRAGARACTARW